MKGIAIGSTYFAFCLKRWELNSLPDLTNMLACELRHMCVAASESACIDKVAFIASNKNIIHLNMSNRTHKSKQIVFPASQPSSSPLQLTD